MSEDKAPLIVKKENISKMIMRGKSWMIAAGLGLLVTTIPAMAENSFTFNMMVSGGAKTCLPNATATVTIRPEGTVEVMDISFAGLPPQTGFDFFVIQVPKAPFGIAWYQGDVQTDTTGHAHSRFVGRFSIETFSFAQGSASAPVVFNNGPFPDASLNPPFNPIQMYHLGLWFNSFTDALAATCPGTVTAFNGDHNAGIQVLNTANFPDDQGPLRNVK